MTTEEELTKYAERVHREQELFEYIEHHGVKGQKWGVRKKRGDRSAFKKSGDAKKAGELKRKPASSLTNKQLKAANERINLEQQFKRLNPTRVSSGKKAATELLATIGIGVAVFNMVNSPAGKAAIAAGKKVLEPRKIAKVAKILSTSGPG